MTTTPLESDWGMGDWGMGIASDRVGTVGLETQHALSPSRYWGYKYIITLVKVLLHLYYYIHIDLLTHKTGAG